MDLEALKETTLSEALLAKIPTKTPYHTMAQVGTLGVLSEMKVSLETTEKDVPIQEGGEQEEVPDTSPSPKSSAILVWSVLDHVESNVVIEYHNEEVPDHKHKVKGTVNYNSGDDIIQQQIKNLVISDYARHRLVGLGGVVDYGTRKTIQRGHKVEQHNVRK